MTVSHCPNEASFAARLILWQKQHGRHDLPWQGADAYGVWISEIMLQQTQVATVIPYYQRFLAAFPDVRALAAASEDEVLRLWSGLGYYARGRNLHRAARYIVAMFGGEFPRRFADISALPGVGRSTAAAIAALAWQERRAILDGNVKRVLARWAGIAGWPGEKRIENELWQCAERLLPQRELAVYTQALMDLGATVCTRHQPRCAACPVAEDCVARASARVALLPTPRPKKAVPERQAVLLLLTHGRDILLQKRPARGIWGGLWSLPQFDDEAAARDWFMRHGLAAQRGKRWQDFIHGFTHFRLHVTPLEIELDRPVALPGTLWLEREEALCAAIPAPVRRLLMVGSAR